MHALLVGQLVPPQKAAREEVRVALAHFGPGDAREDIQEHGHEFDRVTVGIDDGMLPGARGGHGSVESVEAGGVSAHDGV